MSPQLLIIITTIRAAMVMVAIITPPLGTVLIMATITLAGVDIIVVGITIPIGATEMPGPIVVLAGDMLAGAAVVSIEAEVFIEEVVVIDKDNDRSYENRLLTNLNLKNGLWMRNIHNPFWFCFYETNDTKYSVCSAS